MTLPAYLTPAPRPIDGDITIHTTPGSWDYEIRLGTSGHIFINAAPLETTCLGILTALYDNNHLSMETAERVAFLCQSALADNKCPSCGGSGQVGAPWDPESCGACRGTGYSDQPEMTKDEYDAYVADVLTEEE